MSWHNLELNIETLEAITINEVYDNIVYLKSALESAGYTVGSLTAVTAYYYTPIDQVGVKLQDIENDVDVIAQIIESVNWDEPNTYTTKFLLENYQRWVLTLKDLYDIIINGEGQWGQMTLTEETGNPDAQINGIDVYIRGDLIG